MLILALSMFQRLSGIVLILILVWKRAHDVLPLHSSYQTQSSLAGTQTSSFFLHRGGTWLVIRSWSRLRQPHPQPTRSLVLEEGGRFRYPQNMASSVFFEGGVDQISTSPYRTLADGWKETGSNSDQPPPPLINAFDPTSQSHKAKWPLKALTTPSLPRRAGALALGGVGRPALPRGIVTPSAFRITHLLPMTCLTKYYGRHIGIVYCKIAVNTNNTIYSRRIINF